MGRGQRLERIKASAESDRNMMADPDYPFPMQGPLSEEQKENTKDGPHSPTDELSRLSAGSQHQMLFSACNASWAVEQLW